jgi:3-oxoacyl-[acyl-carrier protein] reductase
MSEEDWDLVVDTHLKGTFLCAQAAQAQMVPRAAGTMVFVSSGAARGNRGQANYSAAKAGLVGLTKTLAREWGPFKVNVNAAAFGFIDTRLTASSEAGATIERDGREIKLGIPPQMRELASTIIPLGRPGTPEEAAGAIFFLCSPWSNFVHGQVLTVNGGQMTGMTS